MERWKKNLLVLWIGQFLVMAAMSSIIPFLPLYLQELGMEDPEQVRKWAGLIFGANFLTAFIFSPIWGKLADRHGRKMMVIRSGIGMSIVITLMGFATNPIHLLILRLLNGILSGFIPAAIALTATNTPKEKIGSALGILQSGAVAGAIFGPLFGGLMADFVGFRAIFSYTGITIFLATVIVVFLVHEKFEKKVDEQKTSFSQDLKLIVSKKPMPSLFLVGMLVQLAMFGVLPLIPLYVQELVPNSQYLAFFAGLTAAAMGIANMISSSTLGKVGDKYGAHLVLLFSILGAAMFSIPQIFVEQLWQLIMLQFMLGLCVGGMLPSINALIRHYAPAGMESRTYGYSNSAMFIGNMLGPIISGILAAHFGISIIFVWSSTLLLINALWVKLVIFPTISPKGMQHHPNKKTVEKIR